jgi:antitoxin (DNA-binding transcriptional repressor) of toxin-antitoxin stability system
MKVAGIREARQNLTALIDHVRRGREVLITDRGRPVARLVRPGAPMGRPFRSRAVFRRSMPKLDPPLSSTIFEEREDRL